jgi:hypothetical protein
LSEEETWCGVYGAAEGEEVLLCMCGGGPGEAEGEHVAMVVVVVTMNDLYACFVV